MEMHDEGEKGLKSWFPKLMFEDAHNIKAAAR